MSTAQASSGRAVVITGASTGIGKACALWLDAQGWRVFAGVRRPEDGEALRAEASERLTPVSFDVTQEASLAAAARQVEAALGGAGLSGLVNNAGVAVAAPLEFLPLDELRRQLEINVVGAVASTQAFLPLLRRGRGRIVNMGSVSGRVAAPFFGPYSASKFALEALTDSLRGELRPWGLEVVIVEPGNIATPIWEKSLAAGDQLIARLPPAAHDYYGKVIPAIRAYAKRSGETGASPDKVSRAVSHALTARRPKTRYIVGKGVRTAVPLIAAIPDRLRDALTARQLPKYP